MSYKFEFFITEWNKNELNNNFHLKLYFIYNVTNNKGFIKDERDKNNYKLYPLDDDWYYDVEREVIAKKEYNINIEHSITILQDEIMIEEYDLNDKFNLKKHHLIYMNYLKKYFFIDVIMDTNDGKLKIIRKENCDITKQHKYDLINITYNDWLLFNKLSFYDIHYDNRNKQVNLKLKCLKQSNNDSYKFVLM